MVSDYRHFDSDDTHRRSCVRLFRGAFRAGRSSLRSQPRASLDTKGIPSWIRRTEGNRAPRDAGQVAACGTGGRVADTACRCGIVQHDAPKSPAEPHRVQYLEPARLRASPHAPGQLGRADAVVPSTDGRNYRGDSGRPVCDAFRHNAAVGQRVGRRCVRRNSAYHSKCLPPVHSRQLFRNDGNACPAGTRFWRHRRSFGAASRHNQRESGACSVPAPKPVGPAASRAGLHFESGNRSCRCRA